MPARLWAQARNISTGDEINVSFRTNEMCLQVDNIISIHKKRGCSARFSPQHAYINKLAIPRTISTTLTTTSASFCLTISHYVLLTGSPLGPHWVPTGSSGVPFAVPTLSPPRYVSRCSKFRGHAGTISSQVFGPAAARRWVHGTGGSFSQSLLTTSKPFMTTIY